MDQKLIFKPEDERQLAIQNKIIDINDALCTLVYSQNALGSNFSLLNGRLGVAVCLMQSFETFKLEKWLQAFLPDLAYISQIGIHNATNKYTFCDGMAGIAWGVLYLQKKLSSYNLTFISEEQWCLLDERIFFESLSALRSGNFDYFHGGLSGILYFLDRSENSNCREKYIPRLLQALQTIAVQDNPHTLKWSNRDLISDDIEFNLGLAHGVPSIVSLLSKICEKGVCPEVCRELVSKASAWILDQQNPTGTISLFPYATPITESTPTTSRLAWCYGDLGIAISLANAATCLEDEELMKQAISIAYQSTNRKNLKSNSVYDACFCHGASGIAMIFNHFYQISNIDTFRVAAAYWYDQVLLFSCHEDGIGGYKFWMPRTETYEESWEDILGLLEGIAGISLSLQAAIYPQNPQWSRALLF